MEKTKVKTVIPFSGFYHSFHDQDLDHSLDMVCSDSTGCHTYETVRERMFDLIDWKKAHKLYAQKYTDLFSREVGIDLSFEALISPRYYNYETDRIFCWIPMEEVERIYNAVPKKDLEKKIKDRFTSCDGFISHYPNDLSLWGDLDIWDHNQIGTLLEVYADLEVSCSCGESVEVKLIQCGDIESYGIILDSIEGEEGDRLFKILDYLRQRNERSRG